MDTGVWRGNARRPRPLPRSPDDPPFSRQDRPAPAYAASRRVVNRSRHRPRASGGHQRTRHRQGAAIEMESGCAGRFRAAARSGFAPRRRVRALRRPGRGARPDRPPRSLRDPARRPRHPWANDCSRAQRGDPAAVPLHRHRTGPTAADRFAARPGGAARSKPVFAIYYLVQDSRPLARPPGRQLPLRPAPEPAAGATRRSRLRRREPLPGQQAHRRQPGACLRPGRPGGDRARRAPGRRGRHRRVRGQLERHRRHEPDAHQHRLPRACSGCSTPSTR